MQNTQSTVGARRAPLMEAMEERKLLATFTVTSTGDSGSITP